MKVSYWKEASAILLGFLAGGLLAEAATRVYFSWKVGPAVLLYGTHWYRMVQPSAVQKRMPLTERE